MDEIEKSWKTIHIIWIAMLIALFVYLLVGLSLEDKIDISVDKRVFNIIRYVFYGISAIAFFSIKYVRNYILHSKTPDQSDGGSFASPAVFNYVKATIASLAIAESIAVFGLVLFILGKNRIDLYLLIFVSALAMMIYRPFKEHMVDLMNEREGR